MSIYDFKSIEPKWRQHWDETQLYKVTHKSDKPKYYVLTMFPYPSGKGLHVGHPLSYVAADIFARYKRLKGFNVLHPMGFDAFGLPAEQYAVETGQHPAATTEQNIATFKGQFEKIGFSYDWSREVRTSDPAFYKWTQWIFIQLFNHWYNYRTDKAAPIEELIAHFEQKGNSDLDAATDYLESFNDAEWNAFSAAKKEQILGKYRLAYLDEAEVNWCEALGTVLANDEVKDGVSERGGYPVVKKKMKQWFLRITAYAERLLQQLDKLDWPTSMKEMQRNWIGKSQGALVHFDVKQSDKKIDIFTTRPDTIYGATFMVLAPEHDLVEELTTKDQKAAIDEYIAYVKSRSDVERQQEKKVTGCFTGAYAINPLNGKEVPIYIAEYVLIGYGTGAIMAVPSDDERDNKFAQKFGIEIIDVVDQSEYPNAEFGEKVGRMINSDIINGMEVTEAIKKIIDEIEKRELGTRMITYRMRDAGFSRQRYWGEPFPIVHNTDGSMTALGDSELPLELPKMDDFRPSSEGKPPLAKLTDWVELSDGRERETNTMPGYAGSSWYWLRYMDPGNNNKFVDPSTESYWRSVDLYIGGAEHAVGHLMYSRMWQHFLHDLGLVQEPEPFKKLINQGMIQGRSSIAYRINGTNKFVSHRLKDEHDVTELRVDISMVNGNDELDLEAFTDWRPDLEDAEFILEEGIYKCGVEIEKMSKRWHNIVNPDDVIADYGADVFRMYEMFLGPIEDHKPWITSGIDGVAKFTKKLWRLFHNENGLNISEEAPTKDELKVLHKTINKVQTDIERLSFNTCVSAFMIAVNELTDLKCNKRSVLEGLLSLMAPFAPYITEELWHQMGNEESIHKTDWPQFNEEYVKENDFEYPVSINGKVRAKINLPLELEQIEAQERVLADENLQKWIEGKDIRKFIYVKGRIINVVV